jgi:hypothetical protein
MHENFTASKNNTIDYWWKNGKNIGYNSSI